MAQKITVIEELIDDLDGGEASETLAFGFDGKTYEVDLSRPNADKLREVMKDYVKAGREMTKARKKVQSAANKSRSNGIPAGAEVISGSDASDYKEMMAQRRINKEIRAWAERQGFENVPKTGRIPSEIRDAYNKHHGTDYQERPTGR